MKISGMITASDGENKKGMIDFIDIPFYGGKKYLMKDKILSPETKLVDGLPLIAAPIQAMADANIIDDFVIVGKEEQCQELEELASKISKKPFKVVKCEGHIGETVALGAQRIRIPGYFLILQPDLPFISGRVIDETLAEMLPCKDQKFSIYFPVIDKEFFKQYSQGWVRPFFLRDGRDSARYKSLDFVIADSARINPEFVRKFYNIRMIRSLKGKINMVHEISEYLPQLLLKYASKRLSIHQIEEIGSELNGHDIKIVQVRNPSASAFMLDIDTKEDYHKYLESVNNQYCPKAL